MPRRRNPENRGLPSRWQYTHGAYYFYVPPGLEAHWDGKKRFRLGKTLPEAYREWSKRIDARETASTIAQLLDRYLLEVVPTKAPKSQTENVRYISRLRAVFGAMPLSAFKPPHVYKYVERRGAKTAAHREIEVLSHAFTKAVEWGDIDRHPFKGEVRLASERPRTRYVEDWEIIECLSLNSRRKKGSVVAIQAYIRLKLMTGMARSDLLRLTADNLKEDGVHNQRHKTRETTGKATIYLWTPELRKAVALTREARPALSSFLFCKRNGEGYFDEATGEAHGWDSMWQRFMDRVLSETKVTKRFTEHDLRAKCASDAKSLDHARALLAHSDARTTEAIYRRKPEIVQPLGSVLPVVGEDRSRKA